MTSLIWSPTLDDSFGKLKHLWKPHVRMRIAQEIVKQREENQFVANIVHPAIRSVPVPLTNPEPLVEQELQNIANQEEEEPRQEEEEQKLPPENFSKTPNQILNEFHTDWPTLIAAFGFNEDDVKEALSERGGRNRAPRAQQFQRQPSPSQQQPGSSRATPVRQPAGPPQPGNVYVDNELEMEAGAQIRTIYCGLGRKPSYSVYGNRNQCLRKGFILGKMHIRP